jgi:hypothetical protein
MVANARAVYIATKFFKSYEDGINELMLPGITTKNSGTHETAFNVVINCYLIVIL